MNWQKEYYRLRVAAQGTPLHYPKVEQLIQTHYDVFEYCQKNMVDQVLKAKESLDQHIKWCEENDKQPNPFRIANTKALIKTIQQFISSTKNLLDAYGTENHKLQELLHFQNHPALTNIPTNKKGETPDQQLTRQTLEQAAELGKLFRETDELHAEFDKNQSTHPTPNTHQTPKVIPSEAEESCRNETQKIKQFKHGM